MISDFNRQILKATDNEWIPVGRRGSRFEFFKVRIYGSLHFVKRISPNYCNDLLCAESLRKEFTIGYPLNHPNIVRYLQFDGTAVYEEYIDGETLRELIERSDKRLQNPEFIRKICIRILEALKYLHQHDILHLDLKPENIMITRVGEEVKIIDFGCSINASNDSIPGYTKEYMAPEQLSSGVNTYTDIYQVGMIIKELAEISGNKRKWKKFIEKATANHPDNRFESDDEALKAVSKSSRGVFRVIEFLLMIFIIGGLIGIIINDRTLPSEEEPSEPIKEEAQISLETLPNSYQLKEAKPETPSNTITPKPTEADIEKEIRRLVSDKLTELYSVEVIPMYEKMLEDKEKGIKTYSDREFVDAYMEAYYKLRDYGEELIEKYPAQKDYICERVQRTYEVKTSLMREKLYPPSNIKPTWERKTEVTINRDSIYY